MRTCVPSTSGMSEIAAFPPSPVANIPSALMSPTTSPSSVTLLACSLSASSCMPAVVLYYWTFKRCCAAAAAKSLQSCPTLCNPRDSSPPGSPRPWDSPGKNTGVGCHFLLQCMKVKSESEIAQSCLTLSDPMDCSPPGSSIHGIFQARVLEWGAIALVE